MSLEFKKVIWDFVEALRINKPGLLCAKIYEHIREHGRKEFGRLHGGAGVTGKEGDRDA